MAKTNKSILKRYRVTKTGKILRPVGGINHFQAKKTRRSQTQKKRGVGLSKIDIKVLKAYLHH